MSGEKTEKDLKKTGPMFIWGWPSIILIVFALIGCWLYNSFPQKAVEIYENSFNSKNDTVKHPTRISNTAKNFNDEVSKMLPNEETQDAYQKTGPIGDTFGGTLGPLVALIAAFLTFLAFWAQYIANRQQVEQFFAQKKDFDKQFREQEKTQAVERFENKFYSLIEIHRNNITELIIGDVEGRRAFIPMFNELKFTYYLVQYYYKNTFKKIFPERNISNDVLFNISYLIFFFGMGPNSILVIVDLIGEQYKIFFVGVRDDLGKNQKLWKQARLKNEKIAVSVTQDEVFELDIPYKPFKGHASQLSHYLRNLFQMVKFVDESNNDHFSYESKYNYVATIRAQLSIHEQLLLFYNAVSILGKPWLETPNYFEKYCIVKSIPLPIANFYKRPQEMLPEKNEFGKTMFEWGEIKSRLSNEI